MSIETKQVREHHWDAIRALLMLLGIPYHVALTYQVGEGQMWIVNAHEGVAGFTEIAGFIHIFRMPAFFVIAGYFAALLLERREPLPWLKGRFKRLGIPFLASLVLLSPILNMACELSNFAWPQAWASWLHNSAESGGYWIRHLWFLIVLLYFCCIAAAFTAAFPQLRAAMVGAKIAQLLARHFLLTLAVTAILIGIWEAVTIELFWAAGLATNVPQQILRIDEALKYAPYFLIGCFLARAPMLRDRLYRISPPVILLAIAATIVAMLYAKDVWPPYARFLTAIAAIALTQPVIAVIKSIGDRPRPVVQELVSASFVIYLFHLPILCWLVVLMLPVALPVLLKALLVLLATTALSYCAWLIIRPMPILRLLFDGMVPPRDARAAVQSTQSRPISR